MRFCFIVFNEVQPIWSYRWYFYKSVNLFIVLSTNLELYLFSFPLAYRFVFLLFLSFQFNPRSLAGLSINNLFNFYFRLFDIILSACVFLYLVFLYIFIIYYLTTIYLRRPAFNLSSSDFNWLWVSYLLPQDNCRFIIFKLKMVLVLRINKSGIIFNVLVSFMTCCLFTALHNKAKAGIKQDTNSACSLW